MARCCSPGAYGEFFDEKMARRDARVYRKKGLTGAQRRLVELVSGKGESVLEIGGGVGALQIELLERGVDRATNVELSPAYDPAARELLLERGLEDRVDRLTGDIAENPELVQSADVVLLHRVVCCYPDYEALLGAAAAKAQRVLAFSFPPDVALARAAVRLVNLWPRVRGCDFRAYVHPARAMFGVVERAGFRRVTREQAGIWQVAAFERQAFATAATSGM